ncbi:MAG: phytanoyl-CoA dioxygenase family protein [Vicinamibacterales bacterium]|nr:phytanoyl-CoA dioxygenase family protein [Vicinamibacterales bacterium]
MTQPPSRVAAAPMDPERRRADYDRDGYCVVPRLIQPDAITALLDEYQRTILPSRARFFRQSARWERNRMSAAGFVANPFMGIHTFDHPDGPASPAAGFARLVRNVLCAPAVRDVLSDLTSTARHSLVQSMLFDLNGETEAHQDWYYLDSLPGGHLLAAWVALEDIREEAGRFFVIPGSQTVEFLVEGDARQLNALYLPTVRNYVQTHTARISSPALQRGDVLFWNSGTVHGALPTRTTSYSRKSLTAHYLPEGFAFGSHYTPTPRHLQVQEHDGMAYAVEPLSREPGALARLHNGMAHYIASPDANPLVYRLAGTARTAWRAARRIRRPPR